MSQSSTASDGIGQTASFRPTAEARRSKRDISKSGPLDAGLARPRRLQQSKPRCRIPGGADEASWLQECEILYSQLPKQSRYAQHKRRVISKAIALLKRSRAERTAQEAVELQELLRSLRILNTDPQQQQQLQQLPADGDDMQA